MLILKIIWEKRSNQGLTDHAGRMVKVVCVDKKILPFDFLKQIIL